MAEQQDAPIENTELEDIDDQIPSVNTVSSEQYQDELPDRLLPYELKVNEEYQLRILWVNGPRRDAIESVVRMEERTITDDGYVIVISQPDIDDPEKRIARELVFTAGGTMYWRYPDGDEEITITDVGYFVKPDTGKD